MGNQKIKQDEIHIGRNIREIRLKKKIGQTELIRQLQLSNIEMTRETLVKIERGIQHIYATQLRGIRDALGTSYDEVLKYEQGKRPSTGVDGLLNGTFEQKKPCSPRESKRARTVKVQARIACADSALVRSTGLEPVREISHAPQTCAYTSSATTA